MSDSKDMHINESILSDEIREDLKKNRTNHMEYLPDMEVLESDIQQKVIDAMNNYDYDKYTAKDVLNAINKSNRTPEDFAALYHQLHFHILNRWQRQPRMRKKDILVILYAFLHLYILLITARITVYTVVLTATTRLREPNLMHRK
jgi:2-iminoacetate synthase